MKTSLSSESQAKGNHAFSAAHPIIVSLAFFLSVVALRSIDAFVLRLDRLPDPYICSRVLGVLLVLVYLWMVAKPIRAIGFHTRNFNKAVLIGALSLLLLYTTLYAVQYYRLSVAGETPRLIVGILNKERAAISGLDFALFFFLGQLINAFMEEAIFRGVILAQLMQRFPFWKANVLQAILFGLAHLVFPLSSWLSGQALAGEAAAEAGFLVVFTTLGGLVFGYLYYRTDSLWTAVFAHLIDNVIGLFFHIQTVDRLNAETDILMLAGMGFIALVPLAWIVAKRSNLPTRKPWEAN